MAQNVDVASLLRHLATGFGVGKHDVKGAVNSQGSQAELVMSHDEAVGYVATTLALMAFAAAAEKQYSNRREAIEHIRPI